MILSTNRLVGAAVYRTRKALNANPEFMEALKAYQYAPSCLYDDVFHLWHFPGTHEEISRLMIAMSKSIESSKMKFPCIMNFQPVTRTISSATNGNLIQVRLNLAICAITFQEWTTQTRERSVFDIVLRPIYDEFIRQISKLPFIQVGYELAPHTVHEIYTTGANAGQIHDRYNEHIDAIEIGNLTLTLNPRLCEKHFEQMKKENDLVLTEFI